ncbi:uncharacterized protein LOC123321303 [Coccinella septempunctata]|uniref:uncharacterized protein LOC123311603 n=1 Tax=Coccinella septempunctata TaxID=41139 RepID=UPI001D086C39|nr:uncharacterized protein LOC123311603 [Coccinella septempunctata]XP_044760464.1 uncharacterized protein LOC123317908 [Coccinella septempunctata]XP_044764708.1 uncharacterized protein LOC123321303 [Coccinella septempunctata]
MLDILDTLDSYEEVITKTSPSLHDYFAGRDSRLAGALGVIHFNIRSLRKHFDELLVYLERNLNNLDVIVLSETWNLDSRWKDGARFYRVKRHREVIVSLLMCWGNISLSQLKQCYARKVETS